MSLSPKTCAVCKRIFENNGLFPLVLLRQSTFHMIKKDHSKISKSDMICLEDLDHYRAIVMEHILSENKTHLTSPDKRVLDSFKHRKVLSKNIDSEYEENLTFGENLADQVALFGGSWKFIIIFFLLISVWMVFNSYVLFSSSFDPYPYILLNLILSCLAAVQAPVIMMSQNRQEAKDRARSVHDYEINLKAELEIRNLSAKVDHYMEMYWKQTENIEKMKKDLLEALSKK